MSANTPTLRPLPLPVSPSVRSNVDWPNAGSSASSATAAANAAAATTMRTKRLALSLVDAV